MPKFQHVRLKAEGISVEFFLGEGTPQVVDGYAGWEIIDRPKRRALTHWKGSNPVRLQVPILIDNFIDGDSIEPECRKVEKLAGLTKDGDQPPLIEIHSDGVIPHDFHDAPHNQWVIETLDWGDAVRNHAGNRIRQAATITFLLYVDSTSLKRLGQRLGGGTVKLYVVKRSDKSLRGIAKKQLGDSNRWREIANLNGMRDPKAIFEGQRLRIPPKKKKK